MVFSHYAYFIAKLSRAPLQLKPSMYFLPCQKILSCLFGFLKYCSEQTDQHLIIVNFILFQLPYILTSLQKSVQAVLIGKTTAPDWLTHGIRDKCKMMSVTLTDLQALWPSHGDLNAYISLASDGRYIYVYSCHGLVKIGSGYSNTIKV